MSAWPGKYVIGLTGNIATGKSVVRKMLEHLGAYGIDADALGHRVIAKDAPGYQQVINAFGKWVLGPDEQIDRNKLARVVFQDAEALKQLEAIVHPLVRQAVDILIRRSQQSVIVVEAIKLLESPMRQSCDAIWVTFAPLEVQMARLIQKRGMSEDMARQRISTQSSQEEKTKSADVIIRNEGSFEATWKQILAFWQHEVPAFEAPAAETPQQAVAVPRGELLVERARPKQASEIAALITRLTNGQRKLVSEDIMALFGEKAFLLLKMDARPVGVIGWQVENLVARTDDVYLEPNVSLVNAMKIVMEEVEKASKDLQCEVSLLFLPPNLARHEDVWRMLGYESRTVQSLGVRAWQEAAQESLPSGAAMLFKQLRKDRVLRPV
jgi:dephospho-CoA kinase